MSSNCGGWTKDFRGKMAAEKELELLRSQLKERDEQVHQAAQAGLDLLSQQMELQTTLDEQRIEMTNVIEALEQEKYSLQKEVKLKTRMLESLRSDGECLKSQQSQQLQEQREHLERSHNIVLSELNNKILTLQSSLDEAQLNEKHIKDKLALQTETLNNKLEELQYLNEQTQSSMTSEMLEVQMKIMELESNKESMVQALQESQYKEQQLQLTNSSLQRYLERTTEEKEEREKEAVSWFNALEKSREANQDLQVQLDQALRQAQDPNSKGNSLFAELEDKRAAMEKQLIGMKIQNQSLQKQHSFSKEQLQRMKVQVSILMQQASRPDSAQLERLQYMLSEKNGEIQNLMTKLNKLEKEAMTLKKMPAQSSDFQDETYYTDLLQLKLDKADKEAERLGDELSRHRLKSFSESQRALELERKLFKSDQLLKQIQSDKFKLQLRVEELQYKYEPSDPKKNLPQKRRKEKLPVDIEPPSQENAPDKCEQIFTVGKDVSHEATTNPKTGLSHTTEQQSPRKGSEQTEARAAKCVKFSTQEPVVVPHLSSAMTNEKETDKEEIQQQMEMEEKRKKRTKVEAIYVTSNNSGENQCPQQ